MRKYLLKIALFFVIVVVVDLFFGKICDYLRDNTRGGFSGNINYICEKIDEDIIMMGSSRMRHHYVPQVFEDSLGMSCYNAGIDGNGIILSYGFLEMILQRHIPKLVIYDVTNFDMYDSDNTKFLGSLKPYYDKSVIPTIFEDVQWSEQYKMKSNLYRYNSNLLGLIGDNFHPLQSFDKGYWPSHKVMDYEPVFKKVDEWPVDELKLRYVEKFIDLAHRYDVMLVLVASPTWFGDKLMGYNSPVEQICEKKGVTFFDYFYEPNCCISKQYWSDASHLNDEGAILFSKMIVTELKALLTNRKN